MSVFESGPPIGRPMVENILPGDTDHNPKLPRGLRYHTVDANGDPTTRVFYRADTPTIGANGTLRLALQNVIDNDQGDGHGEPSSGRRQPQAADFPEKVAVDSSMSMQDGGERLDTPHMTVEAARAANPEFGRHER